MGYWPKHPKKELEALLGEFHEASWRVERASKYYKVYCPCGEHKRTVHVSPSNPKYAQNVIKWLYRQECYPWEG